MNTINRFRHNEKFKEKCCSHNIEATLKIDTPPNEIYFLSFITNMLFPTRVNELDFIYM